MSPVLLGKLPLPLHFVGETSGYKDFFHNNSAINCNRVSNNVNESGEDENTSRMKSVIPMR